MLLLSVKVTQGFKTLLPFAIVNISDISSLYDIFEGLCSGRLTAGTGISTSISTNMSCLSSASDCHNISAKIGRNEHDLTLIVLSPDMQEAVNTFGRYVIFNVSTKQGPATSSSSPGSDPSASFCVSPQPSAKNAFDILMYRKKGLVLPGKFDTVRPNAYYSLFNEARKGPEALNSSISQFWKTVCVHYVLIDIEHVEQENKKKIKSTARLKFWKSE